MRFHPFCEIFPLMEGEEFKELTDDIKQHGLREPIWTFSGLILDGRNRFLACQKANIKPVFRAYVGTEQQALALVLSENTHRRHMTIQQRAMVAARIATLSKGSNQHSSRELSSSETPIKIASQEQAAEKMDISLASVKRAKKVVEKGSKALQKAVEKGKVPLAKAAAAAELPKSEQLAAAMEEEWSPPENEEARLAAIEREYNASIDKVMSADDKLAAAHKEIKRPAAEIASHKISRDGYQNRCGE